MNFYLHVHMPCEYPSGCRVFLSVCTCETDIRNSWHQYEQHTHSCSSQLHCKTWTPCQVHYSVKFCISVLYSVQWLKVHKYNLIVSSELTLAVKHYLTILTISVIGGTLQSTLIFKSLTVSVAECLAELLPTCLWCIYSNITIILYIIGQYIYYCRYN